MKKLLKNKLTYFGLTILATGVFLGYFGEGLLVAITHRNQVLAITNQVASPVEDPKDQGQ